MNAKQINLQTPGPLSVHDYDIDAPGQIGLAVVESGDSRAEMEATARTLAAGFNLLDKTGRALKIDAATLGESIDLAALIQAAQDVALDLENGVGNPRTMANALRSALSTLPALP